MSALQIRPHWLLWSAAIRVDSARAHFPLQWQIINCESCYFKVYKEQLGRKKWTQQDAEPATLTRSRRKAGLLLRFFSNKTGGFSCKEKLNVTEPGGPVSQLLSGSHAYCTNTLPQIPLFFSAVCFLMSGLNSSRWLFHTANRIRPRGQIATWSAVKGRGVTWGEQISDAYCKRWTSLRG